MAKKAPTSKSSHHLTRAERRELGKSIRLKCPRTSQASFVLATKRPSPIALLAQADKGRIEQLVPLRHGRMVQSPFTYYRGSALNMAVDLSSQPNSGIHVQCCGDAHLSNFGGFATPERQIICSINDLDETLPAPWEWDVKRLATSFVAASRHNGLGEGVAKDMAEVSVRAYREYMAVLSEMNTLDRWYHTIEAEVLISKIKDDAIRKRVIKRVAKARDSSSIEEVFPKLAQDTSAGVVIKDSLPTMFHWEDHKPGQVHEIVVEAFELYRESLDPARQILLDRYELRDAAIKVVGVGSVGTSCWVVLLTAGDGSPLFLQIKEARRSVLEAFAGKSAYSNQGRRVVEGQRLMQSASDIFLGWTRGRGGRDFFVRQLRDVKIKPLVESYDASHMNLFADWCGKALALCHSRSGDPSVLSGYMGKSDTFDKAVATFSVAYADQNEKDHEVLSQAIRNGKVSVAYDIE